jgi:hypothetical protein
MRIYTDEVRINLSVLCCVFLISILVISCASVPQYDAETDKQITTLQKDIDSQLVKFITYSRQTDAASKTKGSYSQNIDFYDKIDTDITSLELRMEAVPDPSTKNLPQIFKNLREQFKNIQDAHKQQGNLSEVAWTALRNQLNAQFAILLTYELSLKGVGSPPSATMQSTSTETTSSKATTKPSNPPKQ